MPRSRIIVAGGGFGGYHAARTLERLLDPRQVEIVLVDARNYLLYTPFLSAVAGGLREPRHITFPLRELLPGTDLRVVNIESANPAAKSLQVRNLEGKRENLTYDQLVVAVGSTTRLMAVPGQAEHSLGFKTLREAVALRDRLIRVLDTAETLESPDERAAYLTFVFVGAGYAGLGGLAKMRDLAADLISHYPRCQSQGMRWMLVDVNDRIMNSIPEGLSKYAERHIAARDVEIVQETAVQEVSDTEVRLSSGVVVPTRTVVWTAGVEPSSVVARLGLPLDDGGRIVVDDHLRVSGVDDVWAIGDAAAVRYPGDPSRDCPPTRQHAIRQGDVAGANVAARLGAGRAAPYRHRDRGVLVGLGRTQGVAELFGVRLRGRAAWLLTGLYNLKQVPGRVSKLRLLNDWLLDLLLPRISTESGQAAYPVGAGRTAPADASDVGALPPSAVSETLTLTPTNDQPTD